MDWDKTFDGKDILCDETNTYITLYHDSGKWYAEYGIGTSKPYEMKARSLEEAKWRASMNFLNALNKQISKLVRIRSGIPNLKKLKKDANKVRMERKANEWKSGGENERSLPQGLYKRRLIQGYGVMPRRAGVVKPTGKESKSQGNTETAEVPG